ncbi:MAG: tRNA preQ1(34) S-adenosylmethionine ribosyltransferase-isomerase QueA [Patescibacteria group bacterium]|nr:tRNA preQ1(34) S-adenosylmethionine ribosyltransferase-isomerase QueA [Patescibacteria group bacterium]MDD5490495.1 tRNA preQ1(34) S-adenosylmethionine ribosyltransferase-isomerase QueA [Patescibacteria group bacterium]
MPTQNLEAFLKRYDYKLPKKLIAQKPASPRDKAKLLIYRRKDGAIFWDTFSNLPKYLPPRAVLVFNETKVIPARLTLKKDTGGKVRILYLSKEKNVLKVMADRKINIPSVLYLDKSMPLRVIKQKGKYYFLKPSFLFKKFFAVLNEKGEAPIPPYIKNSPLTPREIKKQYQTIFAREPGSVAAPTASLHFTKRLLTKLKKQGIKTVFITLHVNLGTFAPLTEENILSGRLHKEYYKIDRNTANFLTKVKKSGRPVIGVGTTVVRTLESAVGKQGKIKKLSGTTDLFISEGYKFKSIDGLITNFHVPQSSLLMLVAALIGREKLLSVYKKAIKKNCKFFSFGDGMLII